MSDICFILNDEAKDWIGYIRSLFKSSKRLKFRTEMDSGLTGNKTPAPLAKLTIVLVSYSHVEFLQNSDFNYKSYVPDASKAALFLLGVNTEDLKPVSSRFPNFTKWAQFDSEKTQDLVEFIKTQLRKASLPPTDPVASKQFKLIPDTAKCEEPTTIVISFQEEIAKEGSEVKVEALLSEVRNDDSIKDSSSGVLTIVIPAERMNPYIFTFVAPEHSEGSANVRVLINGKLVGSKALAYSSSLDKYNALSQIYLHQLNKLCGLVIRKGVSVNDLDNCLSSLFDVDAITDIPAEAFELLFGMYRFAARENSDTELPTLLHFAAKYGFKELTSKLTDLPDASLADNIKNSDKNLPQDLARINKHTSLSTFLENFKEINEGIEDLYVQCHGYINVGGPGEDLPGYLKARNRLLGGQNSTAEYIVLQPSEIGEEVEDGEDDIYYMYVPSKKCQPESNRLSKRLSTGSGGQPKPKGQHGSAASSPSWSSKGSEASGTKLTLYSGNQQQLVDIMDLYKNKKCTIADVEALFNQWKHQFQGAAASKSFMDKQEKLMKMKEDVLNARLYSSTNRRSSTSPTYSSGLSTAGTRPMVQPRPQATGLPRDNTTVPALPPRKF